ncbi:putative serine protease 47, partial [Physeter macrocephalus]|uniref:Serine protease 47 n=1 Tax=Physeter macrocephalus TaxID=9755 RepID=A0A2Y9S8N8_PHYMC
KSQALETYQVVLGSTQLHQHTQHTREMSLSRIITHPDFEKLHPFGSDIAMLQLLFPVNFTSYIIPACLPVPGVQLPSNSSCWISGWGMLNEERLRWMLDVRVGQASGGAPSMAMAPAPPPPPPRMGPSLWLMSEGISNQMVLPWQHFRTPAAFWRPPTFSLSKTGCLHQAWGDSGGPLVCDFASAWVLMGLSSWGFDCRHPIYRSIFTNVTYFTDWIVEIQRLTPLPEPTSAPSQTLFPYQTLQAARSPGPRTVFVPPQSWSLLLFVLGAAWTALQ